jgi:hypothetical protein
MVKSFDTNKPPGRSDPSIVKTLVKGEPLQPARISKVRNLAEKTC